MSQVNGRGDQSTTGANEVERRAAGCLGYLETEEGRKIQLNAPVSAHMSVEKPPTVFQKCVSYPDHKYVRFPWVDSKGCLLILSPSRHWIIKQIHL